MSRPLDRLVEAVLDAVSVLAHESPALPIVVLGSVMGGVDAYGGWEELPAEAPPPENAPDGDALPN